MNPMISTSQMLLVIQSPPHRVLTQSTTTFQRPPWLLEDQSSHSASMSRVAPRSLPFPMLCSAGRPPPNDSRCGNCAACRE